ncbi:MAG: DUF4827 domain-containing protein [Prevotella sp.]|nr:DUF4827 domain-containing protein [Prevotella sp.]
MRKAILGVLSLLCIVTFVACNDYETYGEKKDKERDAINQFIADSAIVVINQAQFVSQGNTTNLERNEFVYLDNSGVYMQIVRKGCGNPVADGETTVLLVRFYEQCIQDTLAIFNDASPLEPDYMTISRSGSTYSGTFTSGRWYSTYVSSYSGTATVPNGLLVPFPYINVGRPRTADDAIAKVRLIVPHSQGHTMASSYVYAYYYEITFEKLIDL